MGGTRFVTMRHNGWGVVQNGKFGCYVIINGLIGDAMLARGSRFIDVMKKVKKRKK